MRDRIPDMTERFPEGVKLSENKQKYSELYYDKETKKYYTDYEIGLFGIDITKDWQDLWLKQH